MSGADSVILFEAADKAGSVQISYTCGNIIDFAREVHADDLLFANNINAVNSGGNVGFIAMKIK